MRKRTGLWIEQQKLTAADAAAFRDFGISVALSADGKTALIGASSGDGAAYVFVRQGSKWVEQQKLTASDAASEGDDFGWSVDLSAGGETALIGAIGVGCPAGAQCGAVYVFARKGNEWVEQQKLTASDGVAGGSFGSSVALSARAKTALIGAPFAGCPAGEACGAAYGFVRHQGIWVEQQKLTASDGAAENNFGLSVALSANGDYPDVPSSQAADSGMVDLNGDHGYL